MCSTCGCGMPDEKEDGVCEKCGQDPCECPPEEETSSEEVSEENDEDTDDTEDLGFDDDDESLM